MAQMVNDSNFNEVVIQSGKPTVVDFWAPWCGPCRMIAPIVDELAEKYAGKVNIVKCNVDDAADAPAEYGVRNIPTILFFKGGELVDRLVGAVPQIELEEKVEALLK